MVNGQSIIINKSKLISSLEYSLVKGHFLRINVAYCHNLITNILSWLWFWKI